MSVPGTKADEVEWRCNGPLLTLSGHRSYQSAATPERQALLSRAG